MRGKSTGIPLISDCCCVVVVRAQFRERYHPCERYLVKEVHKLVYTVYVRCSKSDLRFWSAAVCAQQMSRRARLFAGILSRNTNPHHCSKNCCFILRSEYPLWRAAELAPTELWCTDCWLEPRCIIGYSSRLAERWIKWCRPERQLNSAA